MSTMNSDIDPASETEEIFFDNGDTLPACFNVDSRYIKEGKQIGKGIWSVHEATWLGRKVAVKKFVAESTFQNVTLTSREVNRMLGLRHPNILKLLGFYLTTQSGLVLDCTMIMELMDFDLEDYIGKGPLSNDQVVYLFAEVARGMNHMHQTGCFHRDLKPKNVLLRKSIVTGFDVDVKIADFGSSELKRVRDINRTAGTMGYKAPEQFDSTSQLFPDKTDVFGFGALCFKILTGKEPYVSSKNVRETIEQLDRAALSQRNLPEAVVEMIWQCLDVNPESRPKFQEISSILDRALSAIRMKMPRPLAPSSSASLPSKESMWEGVQGHESLLGSVGLSKQKHAIYFIPFEELFVVRSMYDSSIRVVEWKGIRYVLKVFSRFFDLGENYLQTFPKLSHKNIVTFVGYSVTPYREICILMELLEMNLLSWERHCHIETLHVDNARRLTIVREIAEGMEYLHDQGVVHGDLKPRNVVVSAWNTDQMTVKLIDFANDIHSFTARYCAPERLQRVYSGSEMDVDMMKADVYSFGILCYEILTGLEAFEGYSRKSHEAVLRGKRPPIPNGTSPEMECLIQSCWSGDPQERPDFTEVCKKLSRIQRYHSYHFSQRCCLL